MSQSQGFHSLETFIVRGLGDGLMSIIARAPENYLVPGHALFRKTVPAGI